MRLACRLTFEAAHRLPHVPPGHKCGKMHGHSYVVELQVDGPIDPESGWIIDYADIRAAAAPLIRELDHACLNDSFGLENPTAENLALWFFKRLANVLPRLLAVRVSEKSDSWAECTADDL